jgi:hypothetical protein
MEGKQGWVIRLVEDGNWVMHVGDSGIIVT